MLHTRSSLEKLLASLLVESPPHLSLSLPLFLSVFLLLQLGNVRLTTQWRQQLHDRWSRPTDRPIPSTVRSFFFERSQTDFFCSTGPVVIVAFIRGSNEERSRGTRALEFGSTDSPHQPRADGTFVYRTKKTFWSTSGRKSCSPTRLPSLN